VVLRDLYREDMTSVLVVEDDASTREALAEALRFVGYVPVTAPTGHDALEAVREQAPDLVVLDLGLPDMDGTAAVVAIRELCDAPILVVSASRRTRRKTDALDAGADDYLDKPFDVSELRARLRAAERRLALAGSGPGRRRFGDLEVDPHGRSLLRGEEEIRLTDIEWRLLDVLISEAGRVVTHRRLAQLVWGAHAGSEVQPALRVHVRSLRRKLGDDVRAPRFIRADHGVGYRWIAPPPPQDVAPGAGVAGRVAALRDELAVLRVSEPAGTVLQEAEQLAEALARTLARWEAG
jgi:two-component system KDP operon response regulator KdpE